MKLATIRTDADAKPLQIRHICGGPTILSEAVKGHDSPPLSYLFIEAVSTTNVLGEAGENRFATLLQTGLAKLNAALTPGNASDLDTLLTFAAPNSGGSQQVNNLVQQATKAQGDITADQKWWNDMFATFGVQDDTIKANIQNQVKQDLGPGQPAQPTDAPDPLDDSPEAPPEAAEQPEAPAAPAAPQGQPGAPGAPGGDLLSQLRGERDAETANQNDIAGQLAAIRKQREENRAEIGHLRNRIDQERANQPKEPSPILGPDGKPYSESVCDQIAIQLLRENGVEKHLNAICGYMLRKIANGTNSRHIAIPTLNEAGLRDRLRSAFNSARNFASNPEYSKRQMAGATSSANNQRAAKLAVQALTDHLRTDFEGKLQESGMTPDQIGEKLKVWTQLKSMYDQGNPKPELIDAFVSVSNEMKKIMELFQSGNDQFDVPEQPVQAEPVADPSAPTQPVPELTDDVPELAGNDIAPQVDPLTAQAEQPIDPGTGAPEEAPNRQRFTDAMAKLGLLSPTASSFEEAVQELSQDAIWPSLLEKSPAVRAAVEQVLAPHFRTMTERGWTLETIPAASRIAILNSLVT